MRAEHGGLRDLWGRPKGRSGLVVLAASVLLSLGGPAFVQDPAAIPDLEHGRFLAPGVAHFFGTDYVGRDVLARVGWGSRISLGVSALRGPLQMLAGTAAFVMEARRRRKMLGGGMRQAGVLAAAGILALDQMVDRLADDHANARRLGEGLEGIAGIDIDRSRIESNMVFGTCRPPLTAREFIDRCREEGVLLDQASPQRWRMVTHRGVTAEDVEAAVDAVRRAMKAAPRQRLRATG